MMVSPISAALISGITSDVTSEKGVVSTRLNDTTYVITLPSGDMTVEVPKGSLYPGEVVTVNSHGDAITIEQVPLDAAIARMPIDDTAEVQQGRYFMELLSLLRQVGSANAFTDQETDVAAVLAEIVKVAASGQWEASSVAHYGALLKTVGAFSDPMLQAYPDKVVTGRIQELIELLTANPSSFQKTADDVPVTARTAMVSLDTSPAPGFYFVETVHDVQQLLRHHLPQGESTETLLKTTGERPSVVRFFSSEQGGPKAAIMSFEQALLEIEHTLRFEMKSAVLQRMDPRVVADALAQKGYCGMDVLQKLDALLSSIPAEKSAVGQPSVLSEPALALTLPQVMALVLDTGSASLPDVQSMLTRTTPQLRELVLNITRLLEQGPQAHDLSDIKKVITESFSPGAIASERTHDLIPLLIKSMGYSLEHDMAATMLQSGASFLLKDFPNLKMALLYMLALCDTVVETEKPSPETAARNGTDGTAVQRLPLSDGGEKNTIKQPDGNDADSGPSMLSPKPLEGIRQQIEQVLNRLESLQMLARQTTTSHGEQNVIVVPIHVGDEYTELRLAFNKKNKKGKKSKQSEHINVHITMDLTALGAIDAVMNYRLSKELSISLALENANARRWFQKNLAGVTGALRELGFPLVQVSIADTNTGQAPRRHFFQKSGEAPSRFDARA